MNRFNYSFWLALLALLFLMQNSYSQTSVNDYLKLAEKCNYADDSSNNMAIYYYSKAIELDENCSECYLNRAWRRKESDPEGSVSDFRKALEFDPSCFKCYHGIAIYYCYEKENYIEARQNYFNALKVLQCVSYQDYVEQSAIIQNIGISYFLEYGSNDIGRKKSKEVELLIWDSLVKANPINRYFEERGDMRSDGFIEDYQGALSDYMVVYDRNKKSKDVLWTYASLLWKIAFCNFRLENYFEALQFYSRVIELKLKEKDNPFSEELCKLYNVRAECKLNLEDYRGAIKDYQLAISVHSKDRPFPRLLSLYNSLARARLLLSDYQNAILDLSKGITVSNDGELSYLNGEKIPDDDLAYTYYLLGFAKNNLKNKEGACKAWSKAGELGYKDAYELIQQHCK